MEVNYTHMDHTEIKVSIKLDTPSAPVKIFRIL